MFYGWGAEAAAAATLEQLGPCVPPIAFAEVYEEILSAWCGNHWGRSQAYLYLAPFIDSLSTQLILAATRLFVDSDRARSELIYARPKREALELLQTLRGKLSIQTHINSVNEIMVYVNSI